MPDSVTTLFAVLLGAAITQAATFFLRRYELRLEYIRRSQDSLEALALNAEQIAIHYRQDAISVTANLHPLTIDPVKLASEQDTPAALSKVTVLSAFYSDSLVDYVDALNQAVRDYGQAKIGVIESAHQRSISSGSPSDPDSTRELKRCLEKVMVLCRKLTTEAANAARDERSRLTDPLFQRLRTARATR